MSVAWGLRPVPVLVGPVDRGDVGPGHHVPACTGALDASVSRGKGEITGGGA